MSKTEAIVNGNFNAGSAGWTGNDMETNHKESAYLGNGSHNRVAEMDGRSGQRTTMSQNITISSSHTTDLTFRTALRNASSGNAGTEGFRVDVVDSSGAVIATQSYFPQSASWSAQSLEVTFPTAGTYAVRFTELGPNDSLGAIIDDVSMLVCFVAGTLMDTKAGLRAVETLACGDLIWTKDAGYLPLLWTGHRHVTVAEQLADARLRPVLFAPGCLGNGLPLREMALSQQHRVCVAGWRAELHFGQSEVLVSAKALINTQSIRLAPPTRGVTYVHFALHSHQIVRSDGVLTESLFASPRALSGMEQASRDELLRLFPDMCHRSADVRQTVRPVLRHAEAQLVR